MRKSYASSSPLCEEGERKLLARFICKFRKIVFKGRHGRKAGWVRATRQLISGFRDDNHLIDTAL